MKKLPEFANEDMVMRAIEEWIDLLAEGKFQEALDFVHPSNYMQFTAESLENWINNAGGHEPLKGLEKMEVTPRHTARGKLYNRDYGKCDPGPPDSDGIERVAWAIHDLPLNGQWSELTAEFFVVRDDRLLVLELVNLRVM